MLLKTINISVSQLKLHAHILLAMNKNKSAFWIWICYGLNWLLIIVDLLNAFKYKYNLYEPDWINQFQ